MDINDIRSLIVEASAISIQYHKIAEISGENFNIFKILDVTTNERRTHSAFLSELLNPKGSHGQKDIFLKLFCEELEINEISYENVVVDVEKFIGSITTDYTEGGYVDILVRDGDNRAIIIENKINACDQKKQLSRYNNFGKKKCNGHTLVYLTLDGKDASEDSKNGLTDKTDYRRISYKREILKWLENCKEKAVNHPILRETITQYMYLIKNLTSQTMNEEFKKEMVELITAKGVNISASIEIAEVVMEAKKKLLLKFAENIKTKVQELDSDINVEISQNFGDQWQGMNFIFKGVESEYLMLCFSDYLREFYFEIVNKNNKGSKSIVNLNYYKAHLTNIASNWGKIENVDNAWNGDWVCRYEKLDRIFSDSKTWADIADNNAFNIITEVSRDIHELLAVLHNKVEIRM